jgi:hypothetical protein
MPSSEADQRGLCLPHFGSAVNFAFFSISPLHNLISRLPPALAAVIAHLPGLGLGGGIIVAGLPLPLSVFVPMISISAALLAWRWQLPLWWRYINLFFLPLVGLGLYLQTHADGIHPNWFLVAFLLLALTSLGAVKTRVPLYLSSPRAATELALRLPEQGQLIDLGCGLGGPLARIHQHRPDAQLVGIEAAPLNWLFAKLRLKASGANAQVRLGSIWSVDLAGYDIVYAYLSPVPMARLWQKARREMKPGSLLISNTFTVPGQNPDEIVDISKPGDLAHARLLIWRL